MSEHVGFTGTREGMTDSQKDWLTKKLIELKYEGYKWFHHGDCIGADTEAHRIAFNIGYKIYIHPPTEDKYRSYCPGDIINPERDYIIRNHDIVNACDPIIATPKGPRPNSLRGQGTWSTIEYTIHVGKPVWVCRLDGTIL